jgi:hypothetical protein
VAGFFCVGIVGASAEPDRSAHELHVQFPMAALGDARSENGLFAPFIYKMIILPRLARDKHRENSKTRPFSYRERRDGRRLDSRVLQLLAHLRRPGLSYTHATSDTFDTNLTFEHTYSKESRSNLKRNVLFPPMSNRSKQGPGFASSVGYVVRSMLAPRFCFYRLASD